MTRRCLILLAVGRLLFGIELGDPLALLLQVIATVTMSTGILTFLYGAISNERTADAMMSVVIIMMALFGGGMMPLEQMPSPLQAAGRFSPVFWAVDGIKRIFVQGAGVADLRVHLLVLFLLGIGTIVPGALLLRGRIAREGR